ncbi:permease [Planctomycetota bacterium]
MAGSGDRFAFETDDNRICAAIAFQISRLAGHLIVRSIWVWLVVGIFVSVGISRSMSGVVNDIGEAGIVASTVLALAISLPLYVCATASLPIAAQLIENGLPVGAALVFLMAGPATNAATVGAIRAQFGWRTLAVYLGTIILSSMLFAAIFDRFFLTSLPQHAHPQHLHTTWWHQASAIILVAMIARFAWLDFRRKVFGEKVSGTSTGWRIKIEGMTCRNCSNGLTDALASVPGVLAVDVTLEPGEALVNGTCAESDLRKAIESAGFRAEQFTSLSPPIVDS